MTTPNIPDLPHTLALDAQRGDQLLQVSHGPTRPGGPVEMQRKWDFGREGGTESIGRYSPADLISELSRFVPIPAEARKVITAWLCDPARLSIPLTERADDLLATLAAAGLLVGPGEPAASEGEPVAWMDKDGDTWALAAKEDAKDYGPLTALYAHPPITAEPEAYPFWDSRRDLRNRIVDHVKAELRNFTTDEAELVNMLNGHPWGNVTTTGYVVTAEPATAPSVEQIAAQAYLHTLWAVDWNTPGGECTGPGCEWVSDAAGTDRRDAHFRHLAEDIRALWSPAPGDAAEESPGKARGYSDETLSALATAESMRNRALALEGALEDARNGFAAERNGHKASSDRLRGHVGELQAENERLRAALEAAEGLLRAKDAVLTRNAEMRTADRKSDEAATRLDVAEQQHVEAYDAWDAARAAVEADTTEEA